MMPTPHNPAHDATLRRFQDALATADAMVYDLTLFVSGANDISGQAIANARRLCDTHLAGRYHLSVVDLHEGTTVAAGIRVLASPTLVRHRPLPVRMIVGDLSHADRVLEALQIPAGPTPPASATS